MEGFIAKKFIIIVMLFRIDFNFVIKVSDFGLAERLGVAKDYIRQAQDSTIKLPLKWMAPESMNDQIFSEHSDVVSNAKILCACNLNHVNSRTSKILCS